MRGEDEQTSYTPLGYSGISLFLLYRHLIATDTALEDTPTALSFQLFHLAVSFGTSPDKVLADFLLFRLAPPRMKAIERTLSYLHRFPLKPPVMMAIASKVKKKMTMAEPIIVLPPSALSTAGTPPSRGLPSRRSAVCRRQCRSMA